MKLLDAQKRRQNMAAYKYVISQQSKTAKILAAILFAMYLLETLTLVFLSAWDALKEFAPWALFTISIIFLGSTIEELGKILKESGKV